MVFWPLRLLLCPVRVIQCLFDCTFDCTCRTCRYIWTRLSTTVRYIHVPFVLACCYIWDSRLVTTILFFVHPLVMGLNCFGAEDDEKYCTECVRRGKELERCKDELQAHKENIKVLHNHNELLEENCTQQRERSDKLTQQMAVAMETHGQMEDVHDEFSNTKLVERFDRQVFNYDWSDLMECLENECHTIPELQQITALSTIMKNVYSICVEEADRRTKAFLFQDSDDSIIKATKKELNILHSLRRRRGQTEAVRGQIRKLSRVVLDEADVVEFVAALTPDTKKQLKHFVSAFTDSCWLMTISHPRLVLNFGPDGEIYRGRVKELFKQYSPQKPVLYNGTKAVGTVVCVVWPAVEVEDGAGIMKKGELITVSDRRSEQLIE